MDQVKERPPYVQFQARIREVRDAMGNPKYLPVDFVLITPVGSRDIVEREVASWLESLAFQVQEQRMPDEWRRQFKGAYEAWKAGQELPLHGTPIANWPVVNSAEAKLLISINCKTVEDLALANEETLHRIGMGARSLKKRADDWLTAQSGTGPLVMQMDALRATNLDLKTANERLQLSIEELKAQVGLLQGRAAARSELAGAGSEEDTPATGGDKAMERMVDDLVRI